MIDVQVLPTTQPSTVFTGVRLYHHAHAFVGSLTSGQATNILDLLSSSTSQVESYSNVHSHRFALEDKSSFSE